MLSSYLGSPVQGATSPIGATARLPFYEGHPDVMRMMGGQPQLPSAFTEDVPGGPAMMGGEGQGGQGGQVAPWVHAGGTAINQYLASLQGMKDPGTYISGLMGKYTQSPWAHLQTAAGIKAANAAAAATGMLGSGAEATQLQRQGQQISQADQQQYLQNLLGVGQQYRGGLSDISQMGERGAMGQMQEQMQQEQLEQQQKEFSQKLKAQQHQAFWGNVAGGVGAAVGTAAHFAFL